MAACGENENNPFFNDDNVSEEINSPTESESKVSRSPSSSSYDRWPTLLVSKKPPSFYKKMKKKWPRDPVIIERRNLVNISKLIVKELIETSLKFGRMLDSDHMPLQHFFIVLEHVLRHGLRPKKGLLGPKKELWDILQVVEKLAPEASDITTSVRDLPTVRTHMGRARAWLRLALMQKKLADYVKVLVDHRDDVMADFFEPDALMMSEEANVIEGLLTGLNVIDCNLCVKEEDLDCQQGVIDFSLYLRSSHTLHTGDSPDDELDPEHMTTVLDQKNYIEELNRHLNATVANLQAKVESLTTTNALMKEDLAISKNNLLQLMEENSNLKAELSETPRSDHAHTNGSGSSNDKEIERLKEQLENEQKLRLEAERELHLQISLKAEMEVAMKLLEKDIHEKQDTIISLRRQLDDIKIINLEMYKKLQECEEELTQKAALVSRLHEKTSQIGNLLTNMQKQNAKATSPTESFIPKIPPFKGTPSGHKTANKNNFSANNGVPKTKNSSLTSNSYKVKNSFPPDKGGDLSPTNKSCGKDQFLSGTSDLARGHGFPREEDRYGMATQGSKEATSPKDRSPAHGTDDH